MNTDKVKGVKVFYGLECQPKKGLDFICVHQRLSAFNIDFSGVSASLVSEANGW